MVRLLLLSGKINVNAIDQYKRTALSYALAHPLEIPEEVVRCGGRIDLLVQWQIEIHRVIRCVHNLEQRFVGTDAADDATMLALKVAEPAG